MDKEDLTKKIDKLIDNGKYDEAWGLLENADNDGLSARSLAYKARCLLSVKNDVVESRRLIRKAYFLKYKDYYYYFVLAEIYNFENDTKRAFKCITKSLKMHSICEGLSLRVELADKLDHPDKPKYIEALLTKAKAELIDRKTPSDDIGYFAELIAYAYCVAKDFKESVEYYKLAFEKGRRENDTLYAYVNMLIYLKDYETIKEVCSEMQDSLSKNED